LKHVFVDGYNTGMLMVRLVMHTYGQVSHAY